MWLWIWSWMTAEYQIIDLKSIVAPQVLIYSFSNSAVDIVFRSSINPDSFPPWVLTCRPPSDVVTMIFLLNKNPSTKTKRSFWLLSKQDVKSSNICTTTHLKILNKNSVCQTNDGLWKKEKKFIWEPPWINMTRECCCLMSKKATAAGRGVSVLHRVPN